MNIGRIPLGYPDMAKPGRYCAATALSPLRLRSRAAGFMLCRIYLCSANRLARFRPGQAIGD